MCGIAGIVGRVEERHRKALGRMNAAMAHRGPDGAGVWASAPDEAGWGILLGHRRLAIDASSQVQPLVDPSSGDALVVDGRIYNHRALRVRLAARGEGDAELLSHLLRRQGRGALQALRGMFALAHWDGVARRLLLARDPLGVKPLYLARNPDPAGGWSIAFASEVRALLASGLLDGASLSLEAIHALVWNGFVPGPTTIVEGVELFDPGMWGEWDARRGAEGEGAAFWSMPAPDAPQSNEEEVAAALEASVRLHTDASAPLAVFLSSGVDSSAVANLAQRTSDAPVDTVTLAFEEAHLNEGPAARRIAEAIGSRHQEVVLSEEAFLAGLEAAVDRFDQPSFDGLNAHFVSGVVRDAGFKVALAGIGGDELFGGYPTFRALPTLHRWGRRTRWVPRGWLEAAATWGTAPLRRSSAPIPPQTRWSKLPQIAGSGGDLKTLYQLAYALFLPAFQRELLGGAAPLEAGLPARAHERLRGELAGRSPIAAVGVMEQRLLLEQRLLRDADNAGMAASVEQRMPLVDHVLLEAVYRLPDALRFQPLGRKEFLRRAGLLGLDPKLFERPKVGFVMPFERWIRRGLRERIDEVLRDPQVVAAAGLQPQAVGRLWRAFLEGAPGVHWSRIWALFILVRWVQRSGLRVGGAASLGVSRPVPPREQDTRLPA